MPPFMPASATVWRVVGALLIIATVLVLLALKWASNLRELLGIRKDAIERKKAQMEVAKMNSVIVVPTTAEVVAYDPKIKAVIKKAEGITEYASVWILIILIILLGAVAMTPSGMHRLQQWLDAISRHLSPR
jgi:hypothetical protein